jgi:hypothetical protein
LAGSSSRFSLAVESTAHLPLVRAVGVDVASQRSSKALFLQVDAGGRTPESYESHDNSILGELYVLNGEQREIAESAGVPVVALHDGLELSATTAAERASSFVVAKVEVFRRLGQILMARWPRSA